MTRLRLLCALAAALALPSVAGAQNLPLPRGHKLTVKIDSSPQTATIYINDRNYGVQGYTPATLKLPKGTYKIMIELRGFKTEEQTLQVTRSQQFTFTLTRQAQPAVLDVRAGTDQSALGGLISVDGTPVGTVPNQVEVVAGSHLLEVKRSGFNDYRDTVTVAEGERRTVVVTMAPQVKPGSILVTSDVVGADVYIDGQRRDAAPALIGDLPEGDHTVEVRKEGSPPWKQLVRVVAGQQTKVVAQLLPAAPAAGSLKVLSATPMADVLVDGDEKGPANAEIRDVRPGTHIVEVRARGFESKRQPVEVKAGEMQVVSIDLAPAQETRATAMLHVISPVPEAEVYLDGALVGKAPVDRTDLVPGKHFIVVRKPGYAEYRVEAELQPGKLFQVSAVLRAVGAIRAITNPPGADVYVDGTPLGKTPATLPDVGVGDHVVELKLKDFLDNKQSVRVEGGQQTIVQADLQPLSHGPTVAELQKAQREQSSFGGMVVDRGKGNIDIGVGDPYFITARLITGLFRYGGFGMDLGVELRTSFYDTQVGVRPRVQILRADPFTLGFMLGLFGGGGPTKRNSFTFDIGPMATLAIGSYVHINFVPYYSYSTDRLCPSVQDIKDDDQQNGTGAAGSGPLYHDTTKTSGHDYGDEKDICKQFDGPQPAGMASRMDTYLGNPPPGHQTSFKFGQNDPRERFSTNRFYLQGSIEIAVSAAISLWILVEGAPFQDVRQSFTSKFNPVYLDNDFPLYVRGGITGKF